jgi:uncharacterized protein
MNRTATAILGLFPLGTVVLPGEIIPLHIYEPRYRQLVADRMNDSAPYGMVFGSDDDYAKTGCAVHVENILQKFPDGRLNIVIRGIRRFRVMDNPETGDPYLCGEVAWVDDDTDESISPDLCEEARDAFRRTANAQDWGLNLPVDVEQNPGSLSWRIAEGMNLSNEAKQNLLEMTCVEERLQAEIRWLQATLLGDG